MRLAMLRRMATYNRWANERLFEACAGLDDATYFERRPAFFGSIHLTLNHLLVADRIWLSRIGGAAVLDLKLDTELYRDRDELRAGREAEDGRIVALMEGLDEGALDRPVRYRNSSGREFNDPLGLILQHMFNHGTHHRGQVHGLLSATAVAPPPLDLIFYARERVASGVEA